MRNYLFILMGLAAVVGVCIAALFNQRADPSGLSYDPIEDSLNAAAKGIQQWPK